MKKIMEKLDSLFDSPTLPRDILSLLSAWRVGFWFLILNATLGLLLGSMMAIAAFGNDSFFGRISQDVGLGQYLACFLLVGICGICTLLVPIRASGLFEGPRWGRYFDQIVLSGITPSRYFAGKIAAQNIFFGIIVLAAMPYAIFSLSLGGTRFGFVITGLFLLWVYANLLTLLTLASSAFYHEVNSVIGVLATFFLVIIIFLTNCFGGNLPFPSLAGIVSPLQYLLEPLYENPEILSSRYGMTVTQVSDFTFSIWGMELAVGSVSAFILSSMLVGGISLISLLMGPVHCLTRANGTFGEVVMPGDNKKKGLLRYRFKLRRRSEMAFFYENRSEILTRWEAPIRYLGILAILSLVAAFAYWILHTMAPLELPPEGFYIINLIIFLGLMLLGMSFFCGDTTIELAKMRAGKYSFTTGSLDTAGFFVFTLFVIVLAAAIPAIRDLYEGNGWFVQYAQSPRRVTQGQNIHHLLPVFVLFVMEIYVFARLFSMKAWNRGKSITAALVIVNIIVWLPWVGFIFVMELYPQMTDAATFFAALTPVPFMIWVVGETMRGSYSVMFQADWFKFALVPHVLITLLVSVLAVRAHMNLRKNQVGYNDGGEDE